MDDHGFQMERTRIFTHLGIVVSLASAIDARMVQVGSFLSDHENPNDARVAFAKLKRAVDKRRALRAVMPANWKQGEQIIEAIRQCSDYRNAMGHGSLDLKVGVLPHSIATWSWVALNAEANLKTVPIDLSRFEQWEYRFRAVEEALSFVVGPGRHFMHELKLQLEGIDVKGSLKDGGPHEWSIVGEDRSETWNEAIDWLFPA